jgi:hypothetical protein
LSAANPSLCASLTARSAADRVSNTPVMASKDHLGRCF